MGREHSVISLRFLPIPTATSAPVRARYGQGTGEIILDDLRCVGTEANLIACPHTGVGIGVGVDNCAHSEDAGAVCAGIIMDFLIHTKLYGVASMNVNAIIIMYGSASVTYFSETQM